MSNKTLTLDATLYDYLLQHSLREPDVLRELRSATMALPESNMQIAPEQGQFMALLVELAGALRILEIGSFTGYSALWMGLALPEDGRIVACDLNREWTDMAARYWKRAGVRERIDLRIGPALDTLDALLADGRANSFDLAFVDADKANYLHYYERCLQLLRRGGLLLFDNVLWDGKVADAEVQDADTVAIRELNRTLHRDQRISLSLVPIGDGLTLARKR
jgi:predicted O-methyltransferase YrrM